MGQWTVTTLHFLVSKDRAGTVTAGGATVSLNCIVPATKEDFMKLEVQVQHSGGRPKLHCKTSKDGGFTWADYRYYSAS
jgi:hypothetical protein